ncbi:hypothetical protein [Diaphorobacter nitroreducens]|uniref:hypothetical protein n=1 Tax=Diaphorobacter nitroreducens TaxID=164759 RepID=UPI0028A1ECE8|nr:hypothetical protein [Diaphorobacter nitroreducens]
MPDSTMRVSSALNPRARAHSAMLIPLATNVALTSASVKTGLVSMTGQKADARTCSSLDAVFPASSPPFTSVSSFLGSKAFLGITALFWFVASVGSRRENRAPMNFEPGFYEQ